MKTDKEFYTSPEVDVFTLQGEGVICASNFGTPGSAGAGLGLDDPSNYYGSF